MKEKKEKLNDKGEDREYIYNILVDIHNLLEQILNK